MASRKIPEINASSMADIAFLLLTFFLIATTLDKAEGIERTVPNPDNVPPQDQRPIIHERNALKILINAVGNVQIDQENAKMEDIKQAVIDHVDNGGGENEKTGEVCEYCRGDRLVTKSTHPGDAVVSLELLGATPHGFSFTAQNFIDQAYHELREEYCQRYFRQSYQEVIKNARKEDAVDEDKEKLTEVQQAYPKIIAKARLQQL